MERVAGEDDARAERDVGAREAVRVAAAVPALVLVAHQQTGAGEELDGREDLLADDRVALDLEPLLGRQRAALVEDRLGHRDLADVVEDGAEAQVA